MALRVESGPLKFGDDWTGVFFRGDCALTLAHNLRSLSSFLDSLPEEFKSENKMHLAHAMLETIINMFDEATENKSQCVQLLPEFSDVVVGIGKIDKELLDSIKKDSHADVSIRAIIDKDFEPSDTDRTFISGSNLDVAFLNGEKCLIGTLKGWHIPFLMHREWVKTIAPISKA